MAVTYKLIETVTVGVGGAANIEFTSIPQTYTDLHLVTSIRESRTDAASANGVSWNLRFNSLTTNQSQRSLYYAGAIPSALSGLDAGFFMWSTTGLDTSNVFASGQVYIPNYAGSSYKSFSSEQIGENNGSSGGRLHAGLWSSTAAITSIQMFPSTGTFVEYSSASLYGIKNS